VTNSISNRSAPNGYFILQRKKEPDWYLRSKFIVFEKASQMAIMVCSSLLFLTTVNHPAK
jgi:hypothetical protein